MSDQDDDGLQLLACEGKCREVTEHRGIECQACGHKRGAPPKNMESKGVHGGGKLKPVTNLRTRGVDLGPGGVPRERERERAVRRVVKPHAAGDVFMPRKGNLLEQAVQKVLAENPPALSKKEIEDLVDSRIAEILGVEVPKKKRMGRPPKEPKPE